MGIGSELASVRADSLPLMIAILQLFENDESFTTKCFYTKLGKNWKRSRCYHYLSALLQLELLMKEKRRLIVTPRAKKLLQKNEQKDLNSRHLLDSEKEIFKSILMNFERFTYFLSLFLRSGGPFRSYSHFIQDSSYIVLAQKYNRESNSDHISKWYITKANGENKSLSKTEHKEYFWTFKYWAKSLDLIDEIHPERNKEYSARVKTVYYPIKTIHSSEEEFKNWLFEYAVAKDLKNRRLVIPELMFDFCTSYSMKTTEFIMNLVRLYLNNPACIRLERISRAFIDETPHNVGKNGEFHYSNYPNIGNYYYGTVVIRNCG